MKYFLSLDLIHLKEWGLNPSQGMLFAYLFNVPTWANPEQLEGETFYFCCRSNIITDTGGTITDKPDTIYRLLKDLDKAGVIQYAKKGRKDLVRITDKGRKWSFQNPENFPNFIKPEVNPEKNPSKPGKKSELNPENFPTEKNTIKNSNKEKEKEKPQAKSLHSLCRERFDFWANEGGFVPIYWDRKEIGQVQQLINRLQDGAKNRGFSVTSHEQFLKDVFDVFCGGIINHCRGEWFAETFTPSGVVSNYNKIVQTIKIKMNGTGKASSKNGGHKSGHLITSTDAAEIFRDLEKAGY